MRKPPRAPKYFEDACASYIGWRFHCKGCGEPMGNGPRYVIQAAKGVQVWWNYHPPCLPMIPYDPNRHAEVR